ncbi:MAG: ADP-ribosylglycohydrolase family protein [Planctomycetota bacterium]|jgi:ADP-ribosylglycohydrolase
MKQTAQENPRQAGHANVVSFASSRRQFLKRMGLAALAAAAAHPGAVLAASVTSKETPEFKFYRDRAMGCWLGAAIGDAMGGPVECQHYKRIEKHYGDFRDLLPYRKPPGLIDLHPGYALHAAPGSITDDTFIRLDLTRFYLHTEPPYTPGKLADYLLKHADFSNWWGQAVKALRRIEQGRVSAEESGLDHIQGGGGGWWQPVAILHAGDPAAASKEAYSLCRIWKAPLERDILSSVVAGQAEAFKKGSSIESVVQAVIKDSGPLAARLFERAVDIASKADSPRRLYEQLYGKALVKNCSTEIDGPMPEHVEPVEYADGFYSAISFAEQQPWALAYLVFGGGDPERTVLTAVKGGRDADSIATNTASWLGAISGESVWPKKWRDTVQQANLVEVDLREVLDDLLDVALKNGTVVKENIMQ